MTEPFDKKLNERITNEVIGILSKLDGISIAREEYDTSIIFNTQKTLEILSEGHPFRIWYDKNFLAVSKRYSEQVNHHNQPYVGFREQDLLMLDKDVKYRDFITLGRESEFIPSEKYVLSKISYQNEGIKISKGEHLSVKFKDNLWGLKNHVKGLYPLINWTNFSMTKLGEKENTALFHSTTNNSRFSYEGYSLIVINGEKMSDIYFKPDDQTICIHTEDEGNQGCYYSCFDKHYPTIDEIIKEFDAVPPHQKFIEKSMNIRVENMTSEGNEPVEPEEVEDTKKTFATAFGYCYTYVKYIKILKQFFDELKIDYAK